ncbi:Ig-like domain-containing alpha-2-macroglobulin family protein [Salisaeta longa]|uniref:Ig-like domain-containing alpha-2-macroglobulin family protein n=1 Tax=Salisaeta longa TaxID=503170 RepID=UPI0003B7BBFB|nr:Ig-like domain-containing alpha-2-macroglobulin family protein [Salisaeta longa]
MRLLIASARLFALLIVAAGLTSCTGSSSEQTSVRTVALAQANEAPNYVPTLDGPLRILSATPIGGHRTLPPQQPLTVTFTRPMVPLGDAPPPPPDVLTTRPALTGTLRWEGTQTLVFTPDRALPPATAFEVTLRPTLTSVDGQTLDAPFTWSFETPRPRLVSSVPARGADFVAPTQPLRLHFNQHVVAKAAAPFLRLYQRRSQARGRRSYAIDVRNASDSTLVVTPTRPLPSGASFVLRVEQGLPSAEGPLGTDEATTLNFETYGPLRLTEVDQPRYYRDRPTRLDPNGSLTLSFSTPVRFEALRKALSFTPAVPWPAGIEARDANVSTSHTLPLTFQPETRYTLTLTTLRDTMGQTLPRTSATFGTRAYEPALNAKTGLLVLEANGMTTLPLRATNVASVRVGMERLTARTLVPALCPYMRPYATCERSAVPARRTVDLDLPRNTPGVALLPFDSLLTGGTGLIGMHLRGPAVLDDRSHRALAQVTRLGVTGKFSPHQILVVVTRLADATPVAGATVTLRNEANDVLWTGTTDAQGRAQAPGWAALGMTSEGRWSSPTVYAVVTHNGDVAFTSSAYDDGVEPYRLGVDYDWSPEPRTRTATLFTDRGLYPAGSTVHFKGIARQKTDGDWAPIRDSLRLVIHGPRGALVYDGSFQPRPTGTLHGQWTASPSATQGRYVMRLGFATDTTLAAEDSWDRGGFATGSFRVDAFRRASFAVEAHAVAPQYVAGDFFEGTISARYLFGAGMAGQPVDYTLRMTSGAFDPDGFDGYRFGPMDGYLYATIAEGDTLLNANSAARVRTPLPGNEHGAPATLTFSGTVTSPTRQTISARTRVPLHPGLFYIGLKPGTSFLDLSETKTLTIDAATVDPNGASVGGKTVTVQLVRQEWNSVREVGADGRLRWRSERTEAVVTERTVTTERGRATRLTVPVAQGGRYVIRATARDVRGNAIRSETYLYASGAGYVAWQRSNDDRIPLITDQDRYVPGETAEVMVQSPYETASALITVEREGILSSRVTTLTGSTPSIEIPLAERHLPNVFVSVILWKGRTAPPEATHDPGAPAFKIGYAELRVDAAQKHLQVTVTPSQDTYRPGETATVDLQLRTAAGEGVPGEIAFSAADAGVLNLIGYRLPDPFETFYGPRPLGVTTTDTRGYLVEQRSFGQKAEALGGGGGMVGNGLRTDFRALAHWDPVITTDGSGHATVSFTLPERLTTFRLMATALTSEQQFGAAHTDVTVTQPLVQQPALPRFARRGDTFSAGVLVSNRTGQAGAVTVRAAAEGLTLRSASEQTIRLPAGATEEVRFTWHAPRADTARLQFRAALGGARDAFATTLPILRPSTKQVSATVAATQDRAQQTLRLPPNRLPELGTFSVRLSSTALVGLDGALPYLFDYPYGCIEQRTSRIRPLLLGRALLDAFDLQVLGGTREQQVRDWFNRLPNYWVGDGFSLWDSGTRAHPYVSAYVVLALAEAQAAGYAVPQPLTQQAVAALRATVRNRSDRPEPYSDAVWTDTRAFMLYALARHGVVLESEVAALASDPPSSPEAVSHLLRTVVHANTAALNRYRDALTRALRAQLRVEATEAYLRVPDTGAYGWIFGSSVRATAHGLTALIEAGPTDAFRSLAQRMVRYLINQRQNGHWASTQDNAAVVDALRAYVEAYEAAAPDFAATVQLAGRTILEEAFRQRTLRVASRTVPAADLPTGRTLPLTVTADGTGTAYYAAQLITYTDAPQPARAQGLRLERTIQRLNDRGDAVGAPQSTGRDTLRLAAGQLVRVTLRLYSPADRNYVVVDDALPAGLEPVNAAFETSDQQALGRADVGASRWWGSFNHTELRDTRVLLFADFLQQGAHTYTYLARATTPGTFIHPPATAEEMYQPAIRGQTATGAVIVTPPLPSTAARRP